MKMQRKFKASAETIEKAAQLIRSGGLVAFPTETVYGIGANAADGEAVARIFEVKGRPRFNPLIVHVSKREDAEKLAFFNDAARCLADTFWPGPLTIVLPRRTGAALSDLVSAGLPTVALRIPAHKVAQRLICAAHVPIAAPSANPSGKLSPTTAHHVAVDLGDRVNMILDGGPCAEGLESTIVGLATENPVLLRAGSLPRGAIEDVLGRKIADSDSSQNPQAPGMLASHYAPRAQLRLNAARPKPGEAYLGFGAHDDANELSLNLSESGNLREAAANLFGFLRRLDAEGAGIIAVAPIPGDGLGEALNDRLRRAAAPRATVGT